MVTPRKGEGEGKLPRMDPRLRVASKGLWGGKVTAGEEKPVWREEEDRRRQEGQELALRRPRSGGHGRKAARGPCRPGGEAGQTRNQSTGTPAGHRGCREV